MKKNRYVRKQKIIYKAIFALTFLIVAAGIILPGGMLKLWSSSRTGKVQPVPEEAYSAVGSALSRNMSENLSIYERLQLISGKWESSISEADRYDMMLEPYEALEMVRQTMGSMYDLGLYPDDLRGTYRNWYTWKAFPYRAVDSVFHTYAAYFWKFCFYCYDSSESHTVYVLEDGTVFLAEAVYTDTQKGADGAERMILSDTVFDSWKESDKGRELSVEGFSTESVEQAKEQFPYSMLEPDGLEEWKQCIFTVGEDKFQMVQAQGENKNLFFLAVSPE